MRKLIQKILSYKKSLILLAFFAIAAGYSILTGVQKNVQEMADVDTSSPSYFPDYPPINTKASNVETLKRGEYLTKAGDCIACHTNTPEKGAVFAGGLPMQTPFGVIYSPNITPDKQTGIGNWTDEQFITAMREGLSPEGHHYFPAFPYLYFNKVTTEDLLAIKAYLNSIPPVYKKNHPPEMVWPFNWRFLQLGWRLLFFDQQKIGPYKADGKQSAQWNRGAYLVEGLGHCAMCHTPSYHIISKNLPLGAPIRKYSFTGAQVQGFLAPNISASNLGAIPNEEVMQVFTHNRLIGGGSVEGPMLEANQDSLRYLSKSDLLAISTYLKSIHSELPPKPTGKGLGKNIYDNYCSGCHASGGGGAPRYGDVSSWSPLLQKGIAQVYSNAIKGIAGMPAKGTCLSCSTDEIKQAVNYMVSAVTGPDGKPLAMVQKPKRLTLNDGKRIYAQNCSVCHNSGFKGAPKPGNQAQWKPMVAAGFVQTYENVAMGRKGHLPRGACMNCTDAELIAAVKYMMQISAPTQDYSLW